MVKIWHFLCLSIGPWEKDPAGLCPEKIAGNNSWFVLFFLAHFSSSAILLELLEESVWLVVGGPSIVIEAGHALVDADVKMVAELNAQRGRAKLKRIDTSVPSGSSACIRRIEKNRGAFALYIYSDWPSGKDAFDCLARARHVLHVYNGSGWKSWRRMDVAAAPTTRMKEEDVKKDEPR